MTPWNPAEWKANPCGCRSCNLCGMHGQARRPEPKIVPGKPKPVPEPIPAAAKPKAPTLFD